ncbi:hypothetical protein TWF191_005224 [Orbilia oligospora]|uniref:Spherulation-specific family 4 n=1 Tax=Orbilia oligospora TaxID=2813651 RepID=A0A7C8UXZ4_ORBOL|nr:hypothetical protein TWF191_005224 [Orbilia oligospora]
MSSILQILATPFACCAGRRKLKPTKPSNSNGTSILFPLYIYPDPGCWDRVFTAVSKHPAQHFTFVINPNSGPGPERFPDAEYTDAIAKLNVYKNVTLIGYVHTTYGTRDLTQVISEVERYAAWATYPDLDIHVDGIFVDEAPGELGEGKIYLGYLRTLHAHTKRAFQEMGLQGYLVTNPGKIVPKALYDYADNIVSFDGSSRKQGELVQMLVKKGIGEVYVTTCDPGKGEGDYSRYSEHWEDFVAEMEKANEAALQHD